MTRSEAKRHLNLQKWSEPLVFCTFWLGNVLRATTACTFSTSQLPKVARTCGVLYISTSKCASRHNGVHFFNISTAKSGPTMVCFVHFDLEMCFARQQRALFRDLNFQKWSGNGVFCTFWLRNVLRATTACTFSTSQLPKVVRPWCVLYIFTWKCASRHKGVQLFMSHLASWLRTRRFSEPTFQPSGATKPRKNTVFRDFPTFSRTCIFFLLIFSLLTLLPVDCFFISPYCRKFDFQTSFDYGDAAHYLDWELRTLLRIKLIDSKKDVGSSRTGRSPGPAGPDSDLKLKLESHLTRAQTTETTELPTLPVQALRHLANKIVEGLRGDAFLIARDLGLEALTQEGGLEHLFERIKSHVFPEHKRKPKNFSGQAKRQVGSYPDNRKSPCWDTHSVGVGGWSFHGTFRWTPYGTHAWIVTFEPARGIGRKSLCHHQGLRRSCQGVGWPVLRNPFEGGIQVLEWPHFDPTIAWEVW